MEPSNTSKKQERKKLTHSTKVNLKKPHNKETPILPHPKKLILVFYIILFFAKCPRHRTVRSV